MNNLLLSAAIRFFICINGMQPRRAYHDLNPCTAWNEWWTNDVCFNNCQNLLVQLVEEVQFYKHLKGQAQPRLLTPKSTKKMCKSLQIPVNLQSVERPLHQMSRSPLLISVELLPTMKINIRKSSSETIFRGKRG